MARTQQQGHKAKSGKTSPASAADKSTGGASDRVVGWVTVVVGTLITAFLWWRNHDVRQPMAFDEYNLFNTALVLWVPLLIILLLFRREPEEFGLCVGDSKRGWLLVGIAFLTFLPVILYFAPTPGSQSYYLGWLGDSRAVSNIAFDFRQQQYIPHTGRIDWSRLAYHEVVMGFYMFGWEFFFRGWLLNGVRKIAPIWIAVLFQAALFMVMHWSKPIAEVLSSFPGAILMAVLALRTRSFVPCFLLHYLISAGYDGAVLYAQFHR